jgi:hypothetical protein
MQELLIILVPGAVVFTMLLLHGVPFVLAYCMLVLMAAVVASVLHLTGRIEL